MEKMGKVQGSNSGARAADDQPKIVAQLPGDKERKAPEEAAAEDGFPGSCQL